MLRIRTKKNPTQPLYPFRSAYSKAHDKMATITPTSTEKISAPMMDAPIVRPLINKITNPIRKPIKRAKKVRVVLEITDTSISFPVFC